MMKLFLHCLMRIRANKLNTDENRKMSDQTATKKPLFLDNKERRRPPVVYNLQKSFRNKQKNY